MSEYRTIVFFHPRTRGPHHGAEPVVLPTPRGCSRSHLPPHPCRVARHATPQAPAAPRIQQAPTSTFPTAIVTYFDHWVQPPRCQARGPVPKPRWMPLPALLYAQVVKTVQKRPLVEVRHRVVCGTLEAVQQVLATCGWQINTAGRCARCCSAACRPGHSPRDCEYTWWEATKGGGLSERRVSTRPVSRASPGVRGPLGGHERSLIQAFVSLQRSVREPVLFFRRVQGHDPLIPALKKYLYTVHLSSIMPAYAHAACA